MRGCQKRVIYLKNTGSRHFEEAYFVIRSGESSSDKSMIDEANRIISENTDGFGGGFLYSKRWNIFSFFIGAASASSVWILLSVFGLI